MMDAASVAVDVGEALVGGPVGIVAALSDFVPSLIGYLAGPKAGAVATQAVEVAKAVTGTQTGDAALSALRASPDLVLKYQELMQAKFLQVEKDAHEERMALIAADQANVQADAADRDSARKREVAVRDWMPGILAVTVTCGFFGLLAYLLRFQVPEDNRDVLNILLGSLGTAWLSIIGYYFGSSLSSAKKDAAIGAALNK
ncbi:MAG: hypothetical protein KGH75_10465 [Rhodospirillales bacterium]|nr:hypothetical protein [Rhodospirillales bacterium]